MNTWCWKQELMVLTLSCSLLLFLRYKYVSSTFEVVCADLCAEISGKIRPRKLIHYYITRSDLLLFYKMNGHELIIINSKHTSNYTSVVYTQTRGWLYFYMCYCMSFLAMIFIAHILYLSICTCPSLCI